MNQITEVLKAVGINEESFKRNWGSIEWFQKFIGEKCFGICDGVKLTQEEPYSYNKPTLINTDIDRKNGRASAESDFFYNIAWSSSDFAHGSDMIASFIQLSRKLLTPWDSIITSEIQFQKIVSSQLTLYATKYLEDMKNFSTSVIGKCNTKNGECIYFYGMPLKGSSIDQVLPPMYSDRIFKHMEVEDNSIDTAIDINELNKVFKDEDQKNYSFISAFIGELATNLFAAISKENIWKIKCNYNKIERMSLITKIENIPSEISFWNKDIVLSGKSHELVKKKSKDWVYDMYISKLEIFGFSDTPVIIHGCMKIREIFE